MVATRVGGIPEVIDQNVTGLLVPPNSGSMLAVAINKVLEDQEESNRLSNNLHLKVKNNFSLHVMIEKTKSLYFKILQT